MQKHKILLIVILFLSLLLCSDIEARENMTEQQRKNARIGSQIYMQDSMPQEVTLKAKKYVAKNATIKNVEAKEALIKEMKHKPQIIFKPDNAKIDEYIHKSFPPKSLKHAEWDHIVPASVVHVRDIGGEIIDVFPTETTEETGGKWSKPADCEGDKYLCGLGAYRRNDSNKGTIAVNARCCSFF